MARQDPESLVDESDDLFNYNINMQDVFRDVDTAMDDAHQIQSALSKSKDDSFGLGIDEEIKVTKKRQPVPKLDEDRLLSQAGIPKLRRLTKERVKFKGKNHEYSDLASLLNIYQFWLDDLYPRAKFADGLAMIEKLGHSKKIQTMRREWINEGKPRERPEDTNTPQDTRQVANVSESSEQRSSNNIVGGSKITRDSDPVYSPAPSDNDLYIASPPRQQDMTNKHTITKPTGLDLGPNKYDDKGVPEDDLDILLGETNTDNQQLNLARSASLNRQNIILSGKEDDFDAEMEAMAEMDDMW